MGFFSKRVKEKNLPYIVELDVWMKGYEKPLHTEVEVEADSIKEAEEAAKDIILSASYSSYVVSIGAKAKRRSG